MNKQFAEKYSDIFVFLNTALFGIGAFMVTYCWFHIFTNEPSSSSILSQRLLGSTMALLFGGFFYSLVILLPNLRKVDLEREKISQIAKSFKIQALTDPLTGAHNRRYFDDALEVYLVEFGKVGAELGLIAIDLDNFKQVNDKFGHDAGDQVLIEVAKSLKASAREYDVIARVGGEEFAIITPSISKSDLLSLADRFRQMIADLEVQIDNRTIRPTASIGVATTGETSNNAKALVKAADKYLYAAKNAGRNQVVG